MQVAGSILTPHSIRILGALIEKELTVPDTYPMTVNGMVTAANQTTNRFPVLSLTQGDVAAALHELKVEHRLVRLLPSGAGSRTDKYRHIVEERFGLSRPEKTVLALLLLRGPQTIGELKARAQRMHDFESLEDVDRVISRLADPTAPADPTEPTDARESGMLRTASTSGAVTELPPGYQRSWPGPLVVRLPRQPGQHEPRVMHLLGGAVDAETVATEAGSVGGTGQRSSDTANQLLGRVEALEAQVAALQESLDALRRELGV
jgi:uncharacterized protein